MALVHVNFEARVVAKRAPHPHTGRAGLQLYVEGKAPLTDILLADLQSYLLRKLKNVLQVRLQSHQVWVGAMRAEVGVGGAQPGKSPAAGESTTYVSAEALERKLRAHRASLMATAANDVDGRRHMLERASRAPDMSESKGSGAGVEVVEFSDTAAHVGFDVTTPLEPVMRRSGGG